MNRVLFNYLFTGYLKTIFKVILIFYCFGLILNLFEEIEFFKNLFRDYNYENIRNVLEYKKKS